MDKEKVNQLLQDQTEHEEGLCKNGLKNLHSGKKDIRKNTCSDIMERITGQLDVLENVIICDEMLIFQYDQETKRQPIHWKTPTSLSMKKQE
jgi:hypothetical protein